MTQVVSQQKLKSAAAGAKPQTALYRGPSHPPPQSLFLYLLLISALQ